MSIVDVIQRAGDRLNSQGLAQSFVSMKQKKDYAEVTFQTGNGFGLMLAKQACGVSEPEYVGVVLWIPNDAFAESKGGAS